MKVPVYNLSGEQLDDLTLPVKVFALPANDKLVALAVRVYLANQRRSYAKTKGRGEVAGTTKKMWSQKGTGRARHGSAKAPIFVGGGVAHGPIGKENHKLSLPKKLKKLALFSVLSRFAANHAIIVVDQFKNLAPKTKAAWHFIDLLEKQNPELAKSRKIGVVTLNSLSNVKRSFGNIPGFSLLSLQSLNPYSLSNQNFLIFSRQAISAFKE